MITGRPPGFEGDSAPATLGPKQEFFPDCGHTVPVGKKRNRPSTPIHYGREGEFTGEPTVQRTVSEHAGGSLHTLFELGVVGSLSDAELLGRYLEAGGEAGDLAFRAPGGASRPPGPARLPVGPPPGARRPRRLAGDFPRPGPPRPRGPQPRLAGELAPRGRPSASARYARDSASMRLKHEAIAGERAARREAAATGPSDVSVVVHEEVERLPGRSGFRSSSVTSKA